MNPLSIALLLGGTALSGIGQIGENAAKNKWLSQNLQADMQQLQQDQAAAQMRNEVMAKYRDIARGFAAENQGNFNTGLATFAPQGQRLDAATATRGSTISDAIGSGPNTNVPLRAGAPSVVQNAYDTRLGDVFTNAQDRGSRFASLGAYGDLMGANARDISGTGQQVQTVNQLAKGNAELLPYEQDLASFKAYSPIFRPAEPDVPMWTSLAKGAGKIGGALAGRMM